MSDREKAIKALEIHNDRSVNCIGCPYRSEDNCLEELMEDILVLLKEQEAVEPTWSRGKPFCGACGLRIHGGKFCSECGKPILWGSR